MTGRRAPSGSLFRRSEQRTPCRRRCVDDLRRTRRHDPFVDRIFGAPPDVDIGVPEHVGGREQREQRRSDRRRHSLESSAVHRQLPWALEPPGRCVRYWAAAHEGHALAGLVARPRRSSPPRAAEPRISLSAWSVACLVALGLVASDNIGDGALRRRARAPRRLRRRGLRTSRAARRHP